MDVPLRGLVAACGRPSGITLAIAYVLTGAPAAFSPRTDADESPPPPDPETPRPYGRLAAALVALTVGTMVLSGCGDDASGRRASGDDTSTTTEVAASVSSEARRDPEGSEREAVIDALLAAEDAALAATAPPPNPEHPDLLATHTGPMLEQTQTLATGLALQGWAIRLPENTRYRVEVQSVEFDSGRPDVAFLKTCFVDDGERYAVATGEIVAAGLFTVEYTDAMQRVDGVWKLAERREDNRWEGEAGCAVG